MRRAALASVALLLLLSVSCGRPTLDLSSAAKFKRSKEKIRASLSQGKRQEFDDALEALVTERIDFLSMGLLPFTKSGDAESAFLDKLRPDLNGKNASEIIAAGREIERAEFRRLRQAKVDHDARKAKLDAEIRQINERNARLKRLAVSYVSRRDETAFFLSTTKLVLRVSNFLETAVAGFSADVKMYAPGRSVPEWSNEEYFPIKSGVEPGETRSIELLVGGLSGIPKVENARFEFDVTRIAGPDDVTLAERKALPDYSLLDSLFDQKKYDRLARKFPNEK